jgi:F0F1-type ATP synthase membrane subunit b/b'
MSEHRIKELEAELLTANESVAKLTRTNAELTEQLKTSEQAFKRVRRTARQDGNTLRDEIAVLQRRRG